MTVSEYIIDFLKKKGVETVFAYPGANVLRLYGQLCESSVRVVLTRHEQGAIHAAAGYAKSTGKIGVCIATSGPGAANLITGIADANLDSAPLLVITGQVPSKFIGRDAFQEADILGITIPVTKHNYLVTEKNEVPRDLEEAWRVANSPRQGPVLVDITSDLFDSQLSEQAFDFECLLPRKRENPYPLDSAAVAKLKDVISSSHRPLVLAGGGVVAAGASELLREFCKVSGIPCVVTMMGKAVSGEGFDNLLGMAGLHGSLCANTVLEQCDLLIAIGCRFSDRTVGDFEAFGRSRTIVHCDIDCAELNKNLKVYLPVCADSADFLSCLSSVASEIPLNLKKRYSSWYTKTEPQVRSKTDRVYIALKQYENEHPGTCIVTDVGNVQTESARLITVFGERDFVTSGGLGAMGFGLPAAIGASFAIGDSKCQRDDVRIILIAGDGGFQMTLQELGILRECPIPVKIIIMNNHALGMVNDMEIGKGGKYLLGNLPDFSLLARAYGINAHRAVTDDNINETILSFLSSPSSEMLEILY